MLRINHTFLVTLFLICVFSNGVNGQDLLNPTPQWSGDIILLSGHQSSNEDSVLLSDGLGEGFSEVSRKVSTRIRLNKRREYSLIFDGEYDYRPAESEDSTSIVDQLYFSYYLTNRFKLRVGKQRVFWGKGFSYIPTDFVNPALDPSGLDLSKEGVSALSFDYVSSGYSVSAISWGSDAYDEIDSAGIKYSSSFVSGLDVDLIYFHSSTIENGAGASFSMDARELISNRLSGITLTGSVALHEKSRYPDTEIVQVGDTELFIPAERFESGPFLSGLLGFSYQVSSTVGVTGEYYHIGDAYSKNTANDIFASINSEDEAISNIGSAWISSLSFGRFQHNYLSLGLSKSSITEGYSRFTDNLTVNLSLFSSVDDMSGIAALSIVSAYWGRGEINIRAFSTYGSDDTEFSFVPYKKYLELGFKIGL